MTLATTDVAAPDVLALLREVLGPRIGVGDAHVTLAEFGLQSRQALMLRQLIADRLNRSVALLDLTAERTVADVIDAVLRAEAAAPALEGRATERDPGQAVTRAPLTEVQTAYWAGRDADLPLGGVATYWFNEYESVPDVDAEAYVRELERAWARLVEHHDALRIEVSRDGEQHVRAAVEWGIEVVDLRDVPDAESHAEQVRADRSHQVLTATGGPLFYLGAVLLPAGRVRVLVGLDALIVDLTSWRLLMRQWGRLVRDRQAALEAHRTSFLAHALSVRPRDVDRRWWAERARTLPAAPELPAGPGAESLTRHGGARRFRRHRARIGADTWAGVGARAAEHGVTGTAVVLAAYALALERFGTGGQRTLALTLAGRPTDTDAEFCVGQFAQTGLFAYADPSRGGTFAEFVRETGRRLFDVLEHASVGGVEVRRLAGHDPASPGYPIVFTSGIGMGADTPDEWLGERIYGVSQTPQVLLDHLAWEESGELVLTMDAVEGAFADGIVEGVLAMVVGLVRELADAEAWATPELGWDPTGALPEPRTPSPFGMADDLLADPAAQSRGDDARAVVFEGRALTHRDLHAAADVVADRLRASGAGPGDFVVLALPKGPAQIVAALGIAAAGAAYVPVDPAWPSARLESVVRRCGARWAVLAEDVEALSRLDVVVRLDEDGQVMGSRGPRHESRAGDRSRPDEVAYAIFTSGSTGEPKGVAVTHSQARCTIDDIVTRYGITANDRVLALSALTFDLSVFDLFGVLGAGGAMVLPAQHELRDPAAWARLIADNRVTIWNTAPALLEMLVEHAEHDRVAAERLASLRIVMLSGDWIPVTLPERLRALAPQARVHSLGGATEAAIWSITYPIERVEPDWTSIPYGRALPGQSFHVLRDGRPAHVGETGELFIGGEGVAAGYVGDPQQTADRFAVHPDLGQRLYRTGDLGRWRVDGTIEFLGRVDRQIKIQGFRIELGEVEAALARCGRVRQAIAASAPGPDGRPRLVAWVAAPDEPAAGARRLREEAQAFVPAYMVPSRIIVLPALPVTANGKVDHQALPEPFAARPVSGGPGAAAVASLVRQGDGPDSAPSAGDPSRGSGARDLGAPSVQGPVAPGRVTPGSAASESATRDGAAPGAQRRIDPAVARAVREVLGDAADFERPLVEAGSTSLDAVRLANAIEDAVGKRPSVRALLGADALADVLASDASPIADEGVASRSAPAPETSSWTPAGRRALDGAYPQEPRDHRPTEAVLGQPWPMPPHGMTVRAPLGRPSADNLAAMADWMRAMERSAPGSAWRWVSDAADLEVELVLGAPVMPGPSPDAVSTRAHARNAASVAVGRGEGASADGVGDEPFAMTEMQLSYLLGRADSWLGESVAPHYYTEVDVDDLSAGDLQSALDAVVAAHPMLRARATADARQVVLAADDPRARIRADHRDLRALAGDEREAALQRVRATASHRVIDPIHDAWLHVSLSRLDDRRSRLHLDLDLLFCDAASAVVLVDALHAAALGGAVAPPQMQFADYVRTVTEARDGARHAAALSYFGERATELPPPPALPIEAPCADARFARREHRFTADWWRAARDGAANGGATATGLLLAALGETIGGATGGVDHSVVVTVFDRPRDHDGVIGDYTSTVIVGLPGGGGDLATSARAVQDALWGDLEHAVGPHGVHGNHVLRELAAAGRPSRFPVAFSSGLGSSRGRDGVSRDAGNLLSRWGEVRYAISQTPNVVLDVQAFEDGDDLIVRWDAVDAAFPSGLLDAMFADYVGRLAGFTPPDSERGEVGGEGSVAPRVPDRDVNSERAALRIIRAGVAEELGCAEADVDPDARFFDLGATSLTVVQLQRRFADAGLAVTVLDFFAHPSAARLARAVARSGQDREVSAPDVGRGVAPSGRMDAVVDDPSRTPNEAEQRRQAVPRRPAGESAARRRGARRRQAAQMHQ